MEVQYLSYIGEREDGYITVRQVKASSPYRRFYYSKNLNLRVGVDIPQLISKFIVKSYPDLFHIKDIELDNKESFRADFLKILELYKEHLNDKDILKIVNNSLTANGFIKPKQKSIKK